VQRGLPKLTALAVGALAFGCAATRGSIGAVLGQDKTDGHVTVREAPASMEAARAGVQVGDEILLIDGRDVRAMSPEAIHLALEGDEGTSVALTVLRHGRILRLSVERGPLRPRR
jgi:C-terminal processing protease CtpA/Prc